MTARIELLLTEGTFNLDGESWDVENNVWFIGDDEEVIVIDGAHDADGITAQVGDRRLVALLCTHAHDDHIDVAPEVGEFLQAPVLLHPADQPVWELTYNSLPDGDLSDGQQFAVAGVTVTVLHTPGHTPGSCSFYVPELGTVFSGDTLFKGGPGATGRSYSDFPTIIESIRNRLLTLPSDTVVRTGHGETTTIADEAADLDEWAARGR
jgi:glyoxylase-like metal-dependent hydrolase (beta-lactamase superfamily II)